MQQYISNIIKIRGFIPMDEFILIALCHPKCGYYSKQNPIKKDFITAPEISNIFGIIFAGYIIDKILPISKNAEEINFVEFGGGTGKLAFDILDFVESLRKINNPEINDLMHKIKFSSIEFSEYLIAMQKKSLENISFEKTFFRDVSEFEKAKNNTIKNENNIFIFFSNEFFDALPIKQFVRNKNDLFEIIVTEKNNQFIYEQIKINSNDLIANTLITQYFENNTFLEFPQAYFPILKSITDIIKHTKSIFLTADYGFTKNPNTSTLQGIFHGKKVENILENIGDSDITHLVNFPLMQSFFLSNGIKSHVISQGEFLIQNGINDFLTKENNSGIERLISPQQMGDLFKVLIAKSF